MATPRFTRTSILALLASSLIAATASAAPLVRSAPTVQTGQAAPDLTISARDIPTRADADERYADDVAAHARERAEFEALKSRLDIIATSVAQLVSRVRNESVVDLPAARIESLERRWRFYERELEKWKRDQQRAVDGYAEEATQIESRREAWSATIAPENQDGAALALRTRTDEVIAALDVAGRELNGPMSLYLGLGRRASLVQSSIDAGLKSVDAAVANYDRRLWQLNEPPMSDYWRTGGARHGPLSAASAGVAIDQQFLTEYLSANRDRWRAHLGFAVLLLPFLLWLSARSKVYLREDAELAKSGQALTRPISSWIVLVLLGALTFESDGPLMLQEAALLLAVIPVLRLLPKQVFDVLGPWPYAATALYVLKRLGFAVLGDPYWHRMHLLVLTLLTLGALVWVLLEARSHVSAGAPGRAQRAARFVGWLAVGVLAISAVLNFAGNVTLAEVLTEGTLDGAYLGLALFAGASVLNTIVRLLLVRRDSSRFNVVKEHAGPMLQAFAKVINVAAIIVWVVATLNSFRIWRTILEWAQGVLTHPLSVGQISLTLGGVLLFFVSVYVAFWIARSMRMVLNDEILPKMSLPRGVANSVATLSYYAIVLVGLLVALAATGFEVSQFAIVLGALSVGIGFGLQNVVNNFVSGLILMFERPIQPGDMVEITGTMGKVREIGMRATTLITPEGADVVVPNGTLLSEKLINWTLTDMNRRVDVDVGVAYGSDLRRVSALLAETTKSTPGIAASPEPTILFRGFGASSLDFGIRAWSSFGDWVSVRTELSLRVNEALAAAGIEIPFPQQDVHVRSVDPEVGDALSRRPPPA